MKKIDEIRNFQLFRNKIETSSGKGENTRPHFWCFETLKQWYYIGKIIEQTLVFQNAETIRL